jgi:6-pyruvoyltetrahydropterin/6-carboxytetrahydropterin synthase
MTLTRVYRFCASHRLHTGELTSEENRQLYGKCNNPFGHGHNYVLHVSVSGSVDPGTGRLINPGTMDRYVQGRILDVFDHKDMNRDVPDFAGVPTTENLAIEVERRLQVAWKDHFGPARLDRVWIQETPRNTFELRSSGQ